MDRPEFSLFLIMICVRNNSGDSPDKQYLQTYILGRGSSVLLELGRVKTGNRTAGHTPEAE